MSFGLSLLSADFINQFIETALLPQLQPALDLGVAVKISWRGRQEDAASVACKETPSFVSCHASSQCLRGALRHA